MSGRSLRPQQIVKNALARRSCCHRPLVWNPEPVICTQRLRTGVGKYYTTSPHRWSTAHSPPNIRSPPSQTFPPGQSVLQAELAKACAILDDSKIPSEEDLANSLEICNRLARSISKKVKDLPNEPASFNTPVTNLLSLEDQRNKKTDLQSAAKGWRGSWRTDIEATCLALVTGKNTFITPRILRSFVSTATLVQRLQNIPAVFDLYASKPVPLQGTNPIIYEKADPTSIKAAVPLDVAQLALDAAIEARDLALCLNIISTTVATSAFRRNKVVRKVSIPAFMVSLTPLAAYELALKYTESATRSDADYAFDHSFLAFLTFFTSISVMGFFAVVQSADMDRVTWRAGTKLHSKWTREEERKFADQIAQAWGFQDHLKRGEEEGKDWKNLRRWLMNRSMDLDRADLMEGME